ncbi:PKD domain-containing protein [Aliikangiella coralliicola]|nr:PKD domain-containing protein [Aliikangiella coralliicola]
MRLKNIANKVALSALMLSPLFAHNILAAQRVDLSEQISLSNNQINIQNLFTQQGDNTYQAKVVSKARNGDERSRYQQHYQGIPIFGATIVASRSESGQMYDLFGHFIAKLDADITSTKPTISLEDATQIALTNNIKPINKEQYYNLESQLYIWLDNNNKAHLAWLISYVDSSEQKPRRPYRFIDAHDGSILDEWDGMTFADATGPGGNQRTGRYEFGPGKKYESFQVTESGNTCRMDTTNVMTNDLNHGTSGNGTTHSFPCYNNTEREVNGSYSALNDAHAFGLVTFDMYKDWYDQSPLTQKLLLVVHYGNRFENAFWDGRKMTFGDGANTYHPLVSLGVVSHEVSHGFTQQNSNLVYRNQSGGLNETFSDVAAAAAYYYLEGTFSWQIGDKIKKNSGAMRYMDDPPRDGRSIGHTRDYRSGMDVHFSSGVYNKAFYLLATSEGWDIRKAFDVYVKANQLYWTSNATFDSAGKGVYSATKDLGYCVDDLVDALEAVGVNNPGAKDGSGCGPAENQPPVANFTYSADKLTVIFTDTSTDDSGVASHEWDFGDRNTSTDPDPKHTYAASGDYTVSLTVKDREGLSDTKTVTISVSDVGQAPNASFTYQADKLSVSFTDTSRDDGRIVSHNWDLGDGNTSADANPKHTYAAAGTYSVTLTVKDDDGLSDTASMMVKVSDVVDNCDGIAAWDASKSYKIGDQVSYDGYKYEAIWWSTGARPDIFSQVWKKLDKCTGGGGNQPPNADFKYSANKLTVSFTDSSSDDKGVTSYAWNFGDGNSSTQQNPTHTYAADGTYSVQLMVTDGDNASDSTTQSVTVSSGGTGNCTAPAWEASKVYLSGDEVSQNGKEYRANWWTRGQSPEDNSGPWQVWTHLRDCR